MDSCTDTERRISTVVKKFRSFSHRLMIDHPHHVKLLIDGKVQLVLDRRILYALKLINERQTSGDPSPEGHLSDSFVSSDMLGVDSTVTLFINLVGKVPLVSVYSRWCNCIDNEQNLCSTTTECKESENAEDKGNVINLGCFAKLRRLKLSKVHLSKLKGLSHLKCQLVSLHCAHSVEIDSVFCDQLTWAELTTLSLHRCAVWPRDNGSYFRNTPWLKKLSLSFCKLEEVDFLANLEHLEHLNLDYNALRRVPVLNPRCKLKSLRMMYNNVSDLSGIERLRSLEGLDLSHNWLPDKYSLEPMKHLPHIIWMNFIGTPLSYVKYYRIYVASSLSPIPKISIDGTPLSITEQAVVGRRLFEPKIDATNVPSTSGLVDSKTAPLTESTRSKPKRSGRPANVRVPVIWDESVPEAEMATPPNSRTEQEEMGPPMFPINSVPSVNYTLNQELMAIEAIIHADTANAARPEVSPPLSSSVPTPSKPDHPQLPFGGYTIPRFNPFDNDEDDDDSPIPEIIPGTVLAQVHAADLDPRPSVLAEGAMSEDDVVRSTDVELSEGSSEEHSSQEGSHFTSEGRPKKRASFHKSEVGLPASDIDITESFSTPNTSQQVENACMDVASDRTVGYEKTSTYCCSDSGCTDPGHDHMATRVELAERNGPSKHLLPDRLTSDEEYLTPDATTTDEAETICEDTSSREIEINNMGTSTPKDSDEESCYESDDEDLFWQVTKVDPSTKRTQTVMLALLEKELKERCPKSGEILTKWSLDSVLSCVKTKNDPITIEMEFDTVKKDKQHRVYIMEYADAKTLTKTVYTILESRPLIAMNQVSQECLKCATIFVYTKPTVFKSKETPPSCPVCGSSIVAETEEPKLPEKSGTAQKPLSHSTSHSSIAVGHGAVTPGSYEASSSAVESCSAVSIEQSQKSGTVNLRKYESDIEVISNPSQSSIEVIDESSRSQSVTPRRKMSEEQQSALATESNIRETLPALSALTESSSSGSLTESVITTYESSSVIINKKAVECLPEENNESPNDNNMYTEAQGTLEEENGNVNSRRNPKDIYSFSDFVDVDLRVKTFIYHTIFKNENEEIRGLVRCHLWKTGGSDYDGCFVLSTASAYFLYHNRTDFSEQICDWLSLNESYSIADLKRVQPIIWNQGVEIQIREFSFILLLMDTERTENLVKHFSDIALKGVKVISKPNTKVELALQQAVLTCDLKHTTEDPSVTHMVMCKSVEIHKSEVSEEFMRLAGLVVTSELFLLIPGDLSWLCSSSQPALASCQDLPSLIEVEKKGTDLLLRFFNEFEATEEKWVIKLGTSSQLSPLVEAIRRPWERRFSVPLEVTGF